MNKVKLQSFDTLKYLLALCVLLGHGFIFLYPQIPQNIHNIAVDGFFLISGFFLAKSCLKLQEKEPDPYCALKTSVLNRYKRLTPAMLFGAVLYPLIYTMLSMRDVHWFYIIFNITYLSDMNGFPTSFGGMWYLTVLFWVSALLSAILFFTNKKHADGRMNNANVVKCLVLPAIIVLTIFLIGGTSGHLVLGAKMDRMSSIYSGGWFRGLLDLSLGMETWFIASFLKSKNIQIKFAFAWELLGLFFVLYPMCLYRWGLTDFMFLPGFMILITLLYLNQESLLKFMSWKPLAKITSCSYMLFILNIIILQVIQQRTGYLDYPMWMVLIALIIGSTAISLVAQKLCTLIVRGLGASVKWLENNEKIIKHLLYTVIVCGIFVAIWNQYIHHPLDNNLNFSNRLSKDMGLHDGKQISRDINVSFNTQINHIKCRFYTWKNEYGENDSVHFHIMKTEDNDVVLSESVKLNDVKDNDVLDIKVNTELKAGKYKLVIWADKTEKPFAISMIRKPYKGNYYIDGKLSENKNDLQCELRY